MSVSAKKSIRRGALIQGVGNVFRLGEFGLTILAAKLFGSVVWGQYVFLTTLIIPVVRLSSLGMDKGIIWLAAKYSKQKFPRELMLWILRFCLASSLLFSFLFTLYYFGFERNSQSSSQSILQPLPFFLIILCIPLITLTGINNGISIGRKKIEDEVVVKTILYPLFYLGLPCIFYFLTDSLLILSTCYVIGSALALLYSFKIFLPGQGFPLSSISGAKRTSYYKAKLYYYSWPIGLRQFMLASMQRIDIWSIAAFLDAKSLGVYGLTLAIGNSLKTIRMALDPVVLPIFSEMKRRTDDIQIKQTFLFASQIVTLLQFPVFTFILFFSKEVLSLSGSEFAQGETALIIFGVAFLFNGFLGLSAMIVMGLDKSKWGLINDSLSVGCSLILNLTLVPKFGITGAALSTSLTYVIINIVWYGEACYLTKNILMDFASLKLLLSQICLSGLFYSAYRLGEFQGLVEKGSLFFGYFSFNIIFLFWCYKEQAKILVRIFRKKTIRPMVLK